MAAIKVYLLVTYGLSCLTCDIRILQNMGDLDFNPFEVHLRSNVMLLLLDSPYVISIGVYE